MARRLHARHQEDVRKKIQADRLLAWLHAGIFGSKFQGKEVILSPDKVSAAKALLNKCLPDLTKTEHSGVGGGPIPVLTAAMSPEEAARAYKEAMR